LISRLPSYHLSSLFFFTSPPTTEIYTLSLHDALPISGPAGALGEVREHRASRRGDRPRGGEPPGGARHLRRGAATAGRGWRSDRRRDARVGVDRPDRARAAGLRAPPGRGAGADRSGGRGARGVRVARGAGGAAAGALHARARA